MVKKYSSKKKLFKFVFFTLILIISFFLLFIFSIFSFIYYNDRALKGEELSFDKKENLFKKMIINKDENIIYYYETDNMEFSTNIHFFTNDSIYDFYNSEKPTVRKTNFNEIKKIDFHESVSSDTSSIEIFINRNDYKFLLYLSNHFDKDKEYFDKLNKLVCKKKPINSFF